MPIFSVRLSDLMRFANLAFDNPAQALFVLVLAVAVAVLLAGIWRGKKNR